MRRISSVISWLIKLLIFTVFIGLFICLLLYLVLQSGNSNTPSDIYDKTALEVVNKIVISMTNFDVGADSANNILKAKGNVNIENNDEVRHRVCVTVTMKVIELGTHFATKLIFDPNALGNVITEAPCQIVSPKKTGSQKIYLYSNNVPPYGNSFFIDQVCILISSIDQVPVEALKWAFDPLKQCPQ